MLAAAIARDPGSIALPAPSAPIPNVPPADEAERIRFAELQLRLAPLIERVFPDRHAAQTVVVIPSLSLDREELTKLTGATHYEERLLCMLMLLRQPRTHVVYVTSEPIPPAIVDYYLHLLPGIPVSHARRRLTLLSCHDGSGEILTDKILSRPRLVERIRTAIEDPWSAHMTCFNVTPRERSLAVRLGIPLYGCDPDLRYLGTKSGSREVFRSAGVGLPPGFEHLHDEEDITRALTDLKRMDPALRRAVIKLEDGFSGEGNAVFHFGGAPTAGSATNLARWVRGSLRTNLSFGAPGETWEHYRKKFAEMGGIVECFLEGAEVRSPSVQCRIDPLGRTSIISTHDQVLGGPTGQVFLGCGFPADGAYSRDIQTAGLRVADILAAHGVLGRFAIDFVSVRRNDHWETSAIEINLRKGGTTHPYLMLEFLTGGAYDSQAGLFRTPAGRALYYQASDNLGGPEYRGLTPDDLIDVAVSNDLHFDAVTQEGVMFHLIGALSEHGKLGMVCIGGSPEIAQRYFRDTVAVLDREARGSVT